MSLDYKIKRRKWVTLAVVFVSSETIWVKTLNRLGMQK
jgi:hypothetical protein